MKKLGMALATAILVTGAAAHADVTIAVVGPMTGSEAAFGEQLRRGAEMVVKDINAKGGVLGQKLLLEVGDDACDPKQAVSVANEMAQKKVAFVVGHFCSGSSIPASNVYNEEGILQISPGSTNPTFTERGLPNVFRTCGRDNDQGRIGAEYIVSHFKGKNVAIVHDKQGYSKGLADETKKALNANGVTEVLYEAISQGEKDYSALISKLKQHKVDILYYGGYKTEAGLIVRQLRDQGMSTVLMGGDALVTNEFWGITGPAGEGTLMTFSPDPRKIPANAELVKRFKDGGYDPEAYTIYTYGTVQAWAQAVDKAKTTETAAVAKTLKADKFDTALGTIGFDAKGDVTAPGYVMYEWKNGAYDYAK